MEKEDIVKVGIITGKGTMIDSYSRALEEILASFGTFIANTLHVLVREMLINIPEDRKKIRNELEYSYKTSELALRSLDEESLSESFLLF